MSDEDREYEQIIYEVDARNRIVREVSRRDPVPGNDVVLSIDLQLQQHAEQTLQQGLREALAGKLVCSICAGLRIEQMQAWLDPSTKVVRAMPNTPSKLSARELLGGRGRRRQMSSAPGMQLGEAERKQ